MKHRLLFLWDKYQFESLNDAELEELILKLREVQEFVREVNIFNHFFLPHLQTLEGFQRERNKKKGSKNESI